MIQKKQLFVVFLVLIIVTAGILQYNYGNTGSSGDDNDGERLGEAVYVNTVNPDEGIISEASVQEAENTSDDQVPSNGFFVQARLEREEMRSKGKELLQGFANDSSTESDLITKAQEDYLNLIKRAEVEATIESLIKQKGYNDAMAYFSENGSVDLIVKASSLSATETAQLADIITRHAGVDMENITVKNVN